MPKFNDLTGKRFGTLVVLSLADKSSCNKNRYHCLCDCGKQVVVINASLTAGRTTTCTQHDKKGIPNVKNKKHGFSNRRDKTYQSWLSMKARCLRPNDPNYLHYGGRGISFCQSWEDFSVFLADLGERPDNCTLDRIDVNGNYTKDNCRWASGSIQSFNKRKEPDNTSGKTGVIFLKSCGKWRAGIQINLKYKSLGSFDTYEEACIARINAELKYYGFTKE